MHILFRKFAGKDRHADSSNSGNDSAERPFGPYVWIGYAFGRIRISSAKKAFQLQNRGEALVSRALRLHFVAPDFHLLNHITLKLEEGTTQIDHILVSRFGVFVIETKDCSGWIFADAKHEKWTQVKWQRKSRFQNPIFQNARHGRFN